MTTSSPTRIPTVPPALQWLAAFGAGTAAGLTAAVLWAPAAGHDTRQRIRGRIWAWVQAARTGWRAENRLLHWQADKAREPKTTAPANLIAST